MVIFAFKSIGSRWAEQEAEPCSYMANSCSNSYSNVLRKLLKRRVLTEDGQCLIVLDRNARDEKQAACYQSER